MINLNNSTLEFRFPEIHKDAVCTVDFQRTLRIPDDNQAYNLPPGLGSFPLFHVEDFSEKLPAEWSKHGGVFLPMHQAEALWIRFNSRYPFAVKIAAGKVNAVSGEQWGLELKGPVSPPVHRSIETMTIGQATPPLREPAQDYVTIPDQPWLDGFNVSEGHIRQFVAMPLGEGYTVEEQLTGEALHGGLQIIVYPLKPELYKPVSRILRASSAMGASALCASAAGARGVDMGLAAGGLMKQYIVKDRYGLNSWDQKTSSRCFVHLLNSEQFKAVTGQVPPTKSPTAEQYLMHGLPWYDYYAEGTQALPGSAKLAQVDSVAALQVKKGLKPLVAKVLPGLKPPVVVKLSSSEVSEGDF